MRNILTAEDKMQYVELKGTTKGIWRYPDGTVADEKVTKNNILLQIRQPIIKLLGGLMTPKENLPFISSIGFGTDDTPPSIDQTGLIAPVNNSRRLIASAPVFSNDGLQVTFCVLYDLVEPDVDNITLKEECLYTTDGTAVARTTIGEYKKIPGLFFEFYHCIGYEP